MTVFRYADFGKAAADGKLHFQQFQKVTPPSVTAAGRWCDMNLSSGTPKYNPYPGSALTATQLIGGGNNGIYPGEFSSSRTKHLLQWGAVATGTTPVPAELYLCDFLMFYPLVDGDDTDIQLMDNTAVLPRYTSGEGLRAIILATAPVTANADVTITYTNSEGVSSRTITARVLTTNNIGELAVAGSAGVTGVNSADIFLPLVAGDLGIRSIDSVQFVSASGGFFCIVLVKPLDRLPLLEINTYSEKMRAGSAAGFLKIESGAQLNCLLRRQTTATSIYGQFIFVDV